MFRVYKKSRDFKIGEERKKTVLTFLPSYSIKYTTIQTESDFFAWENKNKKLTKHGFMLIYSITLI
jgi:hypothetical protein